MPRPYPLRTRVIGVNSHDDIFDDRERFVDGVIYHLEYRNGADRCVIRVADIIHTGRLRASSPFQDFDAMESRQIRHQRFSRSFNLGLIRYFRLFTVSIFQFSSDI